MTKVKKFIAERGPRFIAILGMLGSDQDGERANAASKASQMLREADLTWGEVAGAFGPAPGSSGSSEALVRHLREEVDMLRRSNTSLAATVRELKAQRAGTSKAKSGKLKTFNAILNEIIDQIEARIDLSEWESVFVDGLRKRSFLTDKQLWRFRQIAEQAGVPLGDLE